MKRKKQARFYNKGMDTIAMKELIRRLIDRFGMTCTSHILDQLKTLGFYQATNASFSLGIDDLLAAPSKGWLVKEEDQQSFFSEKQNLYGNLHTVETLRQLMERWHITSEYLKEEMHPKFQIIDSSNPVYMMSFSGARGNKSQIHQLLGIRGLMSDPQGKIVDLPIQGNFQEGLSLTEYIISSYGARKGVVDTAVRTANAGYLTRRLVEVVQHIVVRKIDCGTTEGILFSPIQSQNKIDETAFLQKITGRVLATNVYINRRCIATRNQDISYRLANQFRNLLIQTISIRTPFTCKSLSWICQFCYGQNLSHNNLVELGEAVGLIAGQSIGEPGTQLTLRTFHTGGVFTGNIAGTIRAPFNGRVHFNSNLVYPTRTFLGHPAYMCRKNLFLIIDDGGDKVDYSLIPSKSWLFVQNYQYVESEQLISDFRTNTSFLREKALKHVYSELSGEMHWSALVWHAPKYTRGNVHLTLGVAHLWTLSGGIYKPRTVLFFPFAQDQDQISFKPTFPPRLARSKCLSSSGNIQLTSEYIKTSHSSSYNRRDKNMSFLILLTTDSFRINFFQKEKNDDDTRNNFNSTPDIPFINQFVDFLGYLHSIEDFFSSSRFLNSKTSFNKDFKTFGFRKCYILDESRKILQFSRVNRVWNPKKRRYRYLKIEYPTMNLGQLFWKNFDISKNESFSESGQIIAVREQSLVVRLAKPYLSTPKATIHGNFAEIINQGDPLITFFYERFKASDITQGLPKVEQLVETHSKNPVVQNIEENFRIWNQDMTRTLGSFWGLFISAKIIMGQGRIHFVDQIQKVYQSQGVHICEKHIELIIRQMTSRVLISDDVMFNVFSPGELIGLSRAQRIDRAFDEAIHYQTKLLGITKASFDTPSFISEASFQETARVLAKAALQGRIDWLRGLKENVILSNMIPAGTGENPNYSLFARSRNKNTRIQKISLFSKKQEDVFVYETKFSSFLLPKVHHDFSRKKKV
uniref:DNA-directed RNA polymerase subunit beta'' n=1 Tax=Gnetum ula TaxID=3383 RepID=N0DUC7_9SPER|nr:RNA polymerase beta subunit-2 [Gnetum ula]BAN16892.1 RNA polymerase beta subunit-2 [Gnetum ula]BAT70196.1 RNA polymerase beta subunit-2 [Gnetum ula]